MKKNCINTLILFFVFITYGQIDRSVMPISGPVPSIEIGNPIEFELKNGLKVLMVENHKLPRVSANLLIDNPPLSGSNKNGIYSMTSSMLGKGTKNMKKDVFIEEIDFLGATLNVNAGGAYASSLSRFFPQVLEMMADGVLNPIFSQDEFEKEKNKTLENIKSGSKSVARIARRVEGVLAFGENHPSGKYITNESVENITLEDVKLFYKENLIPNNAYLIFIGDFDPSILKKQVKKLFSGWKKGKLKNTDFVTTPSYDELTINFVDVPNAIQSEVVFQNTVSLTMKDPDYFPVIVANKILGGGPENRLERQIREAKGFTYVARSQIGSSKYTKSRFRAYTSTRFQVTDSAVVELLNEIKKIREKTVGEKELIDVKAKYVGNFVLASERPSTIANYALNIKTQNLDKNFYKSYLANIDKVTIEDIQRVSNKYFNLNNGQIVVTGKGSELINKLKNVNFNDKFLPINYYDNYGKPIEEPVLEKNIDGITANFVINKYLKAIGGLEKLKSVNTISIKYEGDAMGASIISEEKKRNDMTSNSTLMNGNLMMKMVVSNESAFVKQGANKMDLPKNFHDDLKNSLAVFPEISLLNNPNIKFIGKEIIDETEVYAIELVGEVISFKFLYDVYSGLKIREISTTNMGGQTQVQESKFGDYLDFNGILFPTQKSQSLGPQSIEMKLVDVVLNPTFSEEDFN
ncbi:MAG: M16 family metallopeptidase [Flavobacteriaceae bacterium]